MAFTSEQLQRYARHFVLREIGADGQKKLLQAKVLVIGAGALGGCALLYLASAGVGTLGIADFDRVELSNLQRQIIHRVPTVGREKVDSAAEAIRERNPEVTVVCHRERVTPDNVLSLIRSYDFIIDGTDRFETKFLINDACVLAQKPYCHAGVVRFEGQVLTYLPGKGPCLRCLLGEVPTDTPTCADSGVLGAVTGVIGSLQALEAVKCLLGIGEALVGRVLRFDGLTMETRVVSFPHADPSCPVCGEHPAITSLSGNRDDYALRACASCESAEPAEAPDGVREVDFPTYFRIRTEGDLLLDVRDKTLFAFGSIPGAKHLPPEELGKLNDLPKRGRVYVFCQTGDRSEEIVQLLTEQGYDAYNLSGGYRSYLRNKAAEE